MGYTTLPASQIFPTGMYKAFVNVSLKGTIIGHGYGVAEVNTPLRDW